MAGRSGDARRARGHVRLTALFVAASLVIGASACGDPPLRPAEAAPASAAPSDTAPDAEVVIPGESLVGSPEVTVLPAARVDEHATTTEVRVRRLVYRFELRVGWLYGNGRSDLLSPTGELYVDVAGGRLRARFVGNGWPVDDGSEVRMRSDRPGVYVFDARGGRPVGTGQLAAWFQGGPGARSVEMTVRTRAVDDAATIDMVCRLFGEWAGTSIAAVRRTCASDGLPVRFQLGPYRGERTAEAVVYLPEHQLRADHLEPPRGLVHHASVGFHTDEEIARIEPMRDEPQTRRPRAGEALETVARGLLVENRTGARVLVTADGVALGWLDPGARHAYPTLPDGGHRIGAMLPLGGRGTPAFAYALPAHVVLTR